MVRLGKWLATLPPQQRADIQIATKCGEFWVYAEKSTYRNHTYKKLRASVEQSKALLQRIDIVQVHAVTSDVLANHVKDIETLFEWALSDGKIQKVGMSISDPDAFDLAVDFPHVSVLQIQHNILKPYPAKKIQHAIDRGITLIINRPFGMGEIAIRGDDEKRKAFQFLLETIPQGIVLTGTKSIEHLQENTMLFDDVKQHLKFNS